MNIRVVNSEWELSDLINCAVLPKKDITDILSEKLVVENNRQNGCYYVRNF